MKEYDNLESFLEHVSLATSLDQGIGTGFVPLVGNGVESAQVKDVFFAGKNQPVEIPEFEHFQQPVVIAETLGKRFAWKRTDRIEVFWTHDDFRLKLKK